MKFTVDEFVAAAEQELHAWKLASEPPRTDFDYEHLGFIAAVGRRMLANVDKPKQQFIVAEISKSWTKDTPVANLLSHTFEAVINVNWQRGYALKEWKVSAANNGAVLTETIIAIFILIEEALPANMN